MKGSENLRNSCVYTVFEQTIDHFPPRPEAITRRNVLSGVLVLITSFTVKKKAGDRSAKKSQWRMRICIIDTLVSVHPLSGNLFFFSITASIVTE